MRLPPKTVNRIVFALSLLGSAIALYLTLAHMNYLALTCGEIPGCAEVAAHPTARGFGIKGLEYLPTALFGLAMFMFMAALSFARAIAADASRVRLIGTIQRLVAVSAVMVSAWLSYVEAAIIRAWCQWCIASAIVTVLVLLVLLLEKAPTRRDTQT